MRGLDLKRGSGNDSALVWVGKPGLCTAVELYPGGKLGYMYTARACCCRARMYACMYDRFRRTNVIEGCVCSCGALQATGWAWHQQAGIDLAHLSTWARRVQAAAGVGPTAWRHVPVVRRPDWRRRIPRRALLACTRAGWLARNQAPPLAEVV